MVNKGACVMWECISVVCYMWKSRNDRISSASLLSASVVAAIHHCKKNIAAVLENAVG